MGAAGYFQDKAVLRNTFIAVEGTRCGMSKLMRQLVLWINARLVYEDWDVEDPGQIYSALDVEPGWVSTYAETQVRFTDGHLRVATSC